METFMSSVHMCNSEPGLLGYPHTTQQAFRAVDAVNANGTAVLVDGASFWRPLQPSKTTRCGANVVDPSCHRDDGPTRGENDRLT
eukprot:7234692-Alexandrium_andersonii.AAC.1